MSDGTFLPDRKGLPVIGNTVAAIPRVRLSQNSTVLPCPSTARSRYINWPQALMTVSSTLQFPPAGRCLHQNPFGLSQ